MTDATPKTLQEQAPQQKTAGQLPRWDLTEYYEGIDDPRIRADLDEARKMAEDFAARYKGRVAGLSGDEIADALEADTAIYVKGGRPAYYGSLLKSLDGTDSAIGRFVQGIAEAGNARAGTTMFFELELRGMSEDELNAKLAESPRLQQYARVINGAIDDKKHALSDAEEELLQKMRPVGAQQFVRLYEEEKVRRRFDFLGEQLDELEIRLQMSDRDPEIRREAQRVYFQTIADTIHIPAFAMNNIMKAKEIEDTMRGYTNPMQDRNRSNNLEDEVVDTLIETVKENYSATSHRYSKLLAEAAKHKKSSPSDSPKDVKVAAPKTYSFGEAKEIVLKAYGEFSPEMAEIAEKFFDNGWIDAEPRQGKRGGAYSMSAFPGGHPHVFVNFQGRAADVITLAHELGHGVHQYLEEQHQNPQVKGTPLTLAETASIFGEELVFRSLLRQADTLDEKKKLLVDKIDRELGTVNTQIAFCDFERRIHNARKEGELTPEDFGQHWKAAMAERDGTDKSNENGWSTIPHLFRTPFYVYAYGFGQLLVNSLYKAHEEGQVENFSEKYLEALSAGGTKHHSELLAPFNLDASKKEFWQAGVDVIINRIDQLEQVLAEERAQQAAKDAPEAAAANDNAPVRVTSVEVVGKDHATGKDRQQGIT